jgi:hypothetical protein
MSNRLNFARLTAAEPTIYNTMVNSLGQTVLLAEHPIQGDETFVICIFPELQLAFYSDFRDCDDMLADHKEYEPVVIGNDFFHGLN